jgi:FtsZ-binding cell division protein ZapB
MADFLKKAASLLFTIEETETTIEKPETHQQAQPLSAAIPGIPSAPANNKAPADDKIVEKFRSYFQKIYSSANIQGPDFFEFHNMTEAMGNAIPDELKYTSVYAGFSGQVSKEKLMTTGNQYLSILQNDTLEFEQSLQNTLKAKVTDRRNTIDSKAQEIKKLQEKIAAINNEIIELNQQAAEDEARLAAENAAYHQQASEWQQKIKTGLEKINQYIK